MKVPQKGTFFDILKTDILHETEGEKVFFRELETERLFLKNISTDDREFVFSEFSDDAVNRYLFDMEPLTDIGEADGIIEFYIRPEPRSHHRWIIIRKSDGTRMGTCGFHAWDREKHRTEVGYDLKEEFWGKGYMSEALEKILKFAADDMKAETVEAHIYPENANSVRLAEKFGFVLTGSYYEIFRGEKYPHGIYTLRFD